MKSRHIISIGLTLLLTVVSCNDQQMEQGMGYLDLRVSRNTDVEVVPVLKNGADPAVIAAVITPLSGGEDIVIDDVNEITEPLSLPTGDYRIVATSGADLGSAVFDAPFYRGESQFTVRNMQMTTADLVCTLASVKVTAEFSSVFASNFEYKLTVSNGEESLEFSEAAGTLDKAAYFHVTDELSWNLVVTNAKDETFTLSDSYTNVAPRQHYDLYFDIEAESIGSFGAGGFVIIVDNSFNVKEYDMPIYIVLDMPKVLGAEAVSCYSGIPITSAPYEISSVKPYTSLVISHNSTALSSLGLAQSVDLMNASADQLQALESLGVDLEFADANGADTGTLLSTTKDVKVDFARLFSSLPICNDVLTITATNEVGMSYSLNINVNIMPSVEILSVNAWAKFAVIKGRYMTDAAPEGLTIEHKSGASDWTADNILISEVNTTNKTFKIMVCKLSANTTYSFRPYTTRDGGVSVVYEKTTESTQTIPNMNFDQWTNSGDVQYPYTGKNNGYWDTANEGTSTIGTKNITTKETNDVVAGNGCAVRMQSSVVMSNFAAGNIYTGDFDEVKVSLSASGAKLNWGIKFSARPIALKGYYKYNPVKITHAKSPYTSLKGNEMDKCQIQVALADGSSCSTNNPNYYFYVNTPEGKFVDFSGDNKTLIAHNKLESSEALTSYKEFVLPFGYRKVDLKPAFIIVTCCSSYLGDYFTGGEGSTMWADEFEFIYDPSDEAMSDQQRRDFFNLF